MTLQNTYKAVQLSIRRRLKSYVFGLRHPQTQKLIKQDVLNTLILHPQVWNCAVDVRALGVGSDGSFQLQVAMEVEDISGRRWLALELVRGHP
ncbi:hypothetical protein E4H12_11435 [Candidatus Thorarchaeota archaeon]|nr:MAG: hypothetical protein E4H12_11435 [Candidatus Thorarchaeota archaeon]